MSADITIPTPEEFKRLSVQAFEAWLGDQEVPLEYWCEDDRKWEFYDPDFGRAYNGGPPWKTRKFRIKPPVKVPSGPRFVDGWYFPETQRFRQNTRNGEECQRFDYWVKRGGIPAIASIEFFPGLGEQQLELRLKRLQINAIRVSVEPEASQ